MKYILASLFLVGCSTVEPIKPVILNNKDKDLYLEKVETIVSDSASALTAVSPSVPVGVARELVDNQITRLSGVSKPSVEKVESYRRILESKDESAVKKDKEEALKIDSETSKLWAVVEEQETAIAIANAMAENADKERQGAMKDKVLWMISCIGMGISVVGLAISVFTPWKMRGLMLMGAGALSVFSAWILDSQWFTWIIGTAFAIAVADGLFVLIKMTITHLRNRQVRDTPQDNEEKQV